MEFCAFVSKNESDIYNWDDYTSVLSATGRSAIRILLIFREALDRNIWTNKWHSINFPRQGSRSAMLGFWQSRRVKNRFYRNLCLKYYKVRGKVFNSIIFKAVNGSCLFLRRCMKSWLTSNTSAVSLKTTHKFSASFVEFIHSVSWNWCNYKLNFDLKIYRHKFGRNTV